MSKACSRCVESRHICCVQRIYSNAERELSLWISLLGLEAGQGSAGGHAGATSELKSDGGGLLASQSASVIGGVLRGTRRVGQKSGVAADGVTAGLKSGAPSTVGSATEGTSRTGTRGRSRKRTTTARHFE